MRFLKKVKKLEDKTVHYCVNKLQQKTKFF